DQIVLTSLIAAFRTRSSARALALQLPAQSRRSRMRTYGLTKSTLRSHVCLRFHDLSYLGFLGSSSHPTKLSCVPGSSSQAFRDCIHLVFPGPGGTNQWLSKFIRRSVVVGS